jgi:hypothetical protein
VDPFEPGRACPFYVGKGRNGRVGWHRKEAVRKLNKSGTKSRKINIIHKLWRQGLDFEEEMIFEGLAEKESIGYEIETIAAYGRLDNKTGCLANLSDGGEGPGTGVVKSDVTRKKLSKSLSGENNPMYGKKHTKDFIDKLRQINSGKNNKMYGKKRPDLAEMNRTRINPNFGKPMSEEQKKKISEAMQGEKNPYFGKTGANHPCFGKSLSEESRAKMRAAKVGYIPWNKGLRKEI